MHLKLMKFWINIATYLTDEAEKVETRRVHFLRRNNHFADTKYNNSLFKFLLITLAILWTIGSIPVNLSLIFSETLIKTYQAFL